MDATSNSCAICFETLEIKSTTEPSRTLTTFFDRKVQKEDTVTLSCGHEFHRACIEKWAKQKPECPLDRRFITNLPSCYEKVREALFTAIELNQIDEVNRILSDGFNLDQCSFPDSENPLTLSLMNERWEISGILVRAGVNTDNMMAQYSLGWMYQNGRGVAQDNDEAFIWFNKAAVQGCAAAQNSLGRMYLHGQGVEQNDDKAFAWFHRAADQGYAIAQNNLGWMYHNGRGVEEKNYIEALIWYHKAAKQDNAAAKRNLGCLFYQGKDPLEVLLLHSDHMALSEGANSAI